MQIEKKLILCSILAVAIGIATIVPLQYLMNAETASAMPNVEPWFNVDVPYAYCNPYQNGGNGTATWDGATIQAVANFSLTTGAMEADVDAQIEYYKFAVASEQGPIVDMGYYIAESNSVVAATLNSVGSNVNDTITLANGLTYSPPEISGAQATSWSGQLIGWTGDKPISSVYGTPYFIISANNGELPQAATQLRNAHTLSIDVSKVCTVTVKGNVVVTTPADPTILQHIELAKTDNGFIYGTYTEGTLP
jgi:hypothetical protein